MISNIDFNNKIQNYVYNCVIIFIGGEQPIPLWNEHDGTNDGEKPKILLYSLSLQFKVFLFYLNLEIYLGAFQLGQGKFLKTNNYRMNCVCMQVGVLFYKLHSTSQVVSTCL